MLRDQMSSGHEQTFGKICGRVQTSAVCWQESDDGEDAVIRPVFFMFTLVIFVLPLSVVFERA